MRCETCALVWDVNDPDPPQCPLADLPVAAPSRFEYRSGFVLGFMAALLFMALIMIAVRLAYGDL